MEIIGITIVAVILLTIGYLAGYVKGFTQALLGKGRFEHDPERPTIPFD